MNLVQELVQNADMGRGGVKNPENFADVICTCPLRMIMEQFQRFLS